MDFVILKVNGQDLSKASHEDAIKAFETAEEPIVVEVVRRGAGTGSMVPTPPALATTAVQTEWLGVWEDVCSIPTHPELLLSPASQEGDPDDSFEDLLAPELEYEDVKLQRTSSTERFGLSLYFSEGAARGSPGDPDLEVFVNNVDPEGLAAADGRIREGDQILQVNGEDITTRERTDQLFTASEINILVARPQYQEEEEELLEDSEIFCGTDPHFLRLSIPEGDEICGAEIASNVSHQDSGVGHDSLHNEESSGHEEDTYASRSQTVNGVVACNGSTHHVASDELLSQEQGDNEGLPSTHGDTDASLDKELYYLSKKMENIQQECESIMVRYVVDSACDAVAQESDHVYETIPEQSEGDEHIYSLPYEPRPLQSVQKVDLTQIRLNKQVPKSVDSNVNPWIRQDSDVMANRHQEVEQWVKSSVPSGKTSTSSKTGSQSGSDKDSWIKTSSSHDSRSSVESGKCKGSGDNTQPKKPRYRDSEDKGKDSSSAYNTGDSCRSTPLTLELGQSKENNRSTLVLCPPPGMEDRGMQVNLDNSDAYSVFSCESCRQCLNLTVPPIPMQNGRNKENMKKSKSDKSIKDKHHEVKQNQNSSTTPRNYATFVPENTMYTNEANLEHTIWLQQQLFRQAMLKQQQMQVKMQKMEQRQRNYYNIREGEYVKVKQSEQGVSGPYGVLAPSNPTMMEWKVKKRSDGTRYITRRPARNRILKERAEKINEERCGISTDDDTMSELKVGRYWNKEQRKRHLEKSRERRRRQEEMIKTKGVTNVKQTKEECRDAGMRNIVELSHRKMARRKTHPDDFTTVQEILVQPNRGGAQGKVGGLLSVTTV